MAKFKVDQPQETDTPNITVELSPEEPLAVGEHKFELVVIDDSGNASEPAIASVIVRDLEKPTAVLDVPRQVGFGQSFEISGKRSTDLPPGKIKTYRFRLLN